MAFECMCYDIILNAFSVVRNLYFLFWMHQDSNWRSKHSRRVFVPIRTKHHMQGVRLLSYAKDLLSLQCVSINLKQPKPASA